MPYATTNQLKNELGIDTADTSQDTYLTDLLARVSAWIETYCGRVFAALASTVTDELHERESAVIYLHRPRVKSITSVSYKNRQTDSWTALATTDYEWSSTGRLDLGLPYEYIKVTYTYGGDGIPKEIEGACVAIAARIYRNSSIKREQLGDLEIEFQNNQEIKPTDELGVLNAYRVRHV